MQMKKRASSVKPSKTRQAILRRRAGLSVVIVFLLLATAAWGQTIYVNRWHRGDQPSDGTAGRPFRSLTEAYNAAPPGRMTTIQVETGVYPERPTLGSAPSRQVTLVARGGPVTIGVFSPNVLTQHNDNERTGANLQEVVLNTSNVNHHGLKVRGLRMTTESRHVTTQVAPRMAG